MPSYVTDLEEITELVSDWAVKLIEEITEALLENGRPFDTVELTNEEKLQEYLKYRGNPEAWAQYVNSMAEKIFNTLQENGVSVDAIASVHPVDIALRFAYQYSYEMERLIDGLQS